MSELEDPFEYSRSTESKVVKIGALVASILMTGGCVTYICLCIVLCIHRICFENGEAADDVGNEDDRNAAIDAGLTTKVRSDVLRYISVSIVLERAAF